MRRYAGDQAQQVVVIGGMEAQRRRRRSRPPDLDAKPVDVIRATVIAADPLDGERSADAWLEQAGETVAAALAVLNRALHAHRIAAADPYAGEITLRHALVTRVGYGTGEQVAEGLWTTARELPPERGRIAREAALRPQERFAALLAARDAAPACELLALRARLDLDQARDREAALQTEAALGAALGGAGELARAARHAGAARRAAHVRRRRRRGGRGGADGRAGGVRARRRRAGARAARGGAAGADGGGFVLSRRAVAPASQRLRRAAAVGLAHSRKSPSGATPGPALTVRQRRQHGLELRDHVAVELHDRIRSYGVGPIVTSATTPPAPNVIRGSCATG